MIKVGPSCLGLNHGAATEAPQLPFPEGEQQILGT